MTEVTGLRSAERGRGDGGPPDPRKNGGIDSGKRRFRLVLTFADLPHFFEIEGQSGGAGGFPVHRFAASPSLRCAEAAGGSHWFSVSWEELHRFTEILTL